MQTLDVILILAAAGCWVAAGLLPLAGPRGDRAGTALGMLGALLAGTGALRALAGVPEAGLGFSFWGLPARLEVDALSAAFLLPLQLVAGMALLYGREYWPLSAPKGSGRLVRFFFAVQVAAMTVLFVARQGLLFLVAWEAMAVSAFFLIQAEHERPEVRRAGWVYLVSTHAGTLALTAMVILLAHRSGSLLWIPAAGSGSALDGWILLLALVGFGFKMGLFPLHYWLPSAHAGAPSHASALLSAVMLKAGVYGLLRVSGLLPTIPRGFGGGLLALGALTAVWGVGNALAQRDFKRLLAYSSVENLGIIAMGVGLGWTGRATHDPWLAALGFGAALFHVWNHATFKGLLFLGSGAVLHGTGTRDMEALGGLGRRMPRTFLCLVPAVLAVAALPPFNAFLSEWFLYRGLFTSLFQGYPWSGGLALVALALTGGLAAVAFARFFGIVFLGEPRSEAPAHAHDPSRTMLAPMAALAGLCLLLGLASPWLLPFLGRAAAGGGGLDPGLLTQALGRDLHRLAALLALLLVLGALGWAWLRRNPTAAARPGTWDCGYAAPTARMQYTGSSFAGFWAALLPGRTVRMRRLRALFPTPHTLHADVQDAVGEGLVAPWFGRLAARAQRLRRLQPGYLSVYVLYVLLALLAVFLWPLLRARVLG